MEQLNLSAITPADLLAYLLKQRESKTKEEKFEAAIIEYCKEKNDSTYGWNVPKNVMPGW